MLKYISVSVITLLIIAVVSVVIYEERSKSALQDLITARTAELQKAKLDIGRAETKLGEANTMISKLSREIQEEIRQRQATLKLYAELQGKYQAEQDKVKIVTQIIYRDQEVPIPVGKIFVKLDDGTYSEVTSMVFNYKDFRIDISGDAVKQTLSYKLHERFRGVFVESELPGGGTNHYAEIFEQDANGKDTGRLELTVFIVIKSKDITSRMFWFNPKLDLFVGYLYAPGAHSWQAGLGLSFSGYGATPDDLTWRFFRLGTGVTSNDVFIDLSPAQYNLGQNIPLISNFWLTPSVGYIFN